MHVICLFSKLPLYFSIEKKTSSLGVERLHTRKGKNECMVRCCSLLCAGRKMSLKISSAILRSEVVLSYYS